MATTASGSVWYPAPARDRQIYRNAIYRAEAQERGD
jgi:hypothetical protein